MPRSYEDYLEFIEMDFEWEDFSTWEEAFDQLQENYEQTFIDMYQGELEERYYSSN